MKIFSNKFSIVKDEEGQSRDYALFYIVLVSLRSRCEANVAASPQCNFFDWLSFHTAKARWKSRLLKQSSKLKLDPEDPKRAIYHPLCSKGFKVASPQRFWWHFSSYKGARLLSKIIYSMDR